MYALIIKNDYTSYTVLVGGGGGRGSLFWTGE